MQGSVVSQCLPIGTKFANRVFGLLVFLIVSIGAAGQSHAQTSGNFKVEVQVASQSNKERNSAYWLAFDRVLRRQVETRVRIEPFQREELMKDPSLYVQSFRYRRLDPGADSSRLATRSVREGAPAAAIIAVTFPTDLPAIIQQQLIPVVEEQVVPTVSPIVALVAVEQQGSQFIIGGDRGKKFQARAMQLAAANNLQLQFPEITTEDSETINAADIFGADTDRINNFAARYQGTDLLTGALYRLSQSAWQSDWNYTGQNQQPQSFSLTTTTLDEALVAAMTQISPGGGYLAAGYDDGSMGGFERAGMAFRIENIKSLADYDNVLAMLRKLDSGVVTETLDYESMVFRASEQGASNVRNSLMASRNFEAINADQYAGELSFRYQQ